MNNISILGSTGSIGCQTLDVARQMSNQISICALAAGCNIKLLKAQIAEFHPLIASVTSEEDARSIRDFAKEHGTEILWGNEGLLAVATLSNVNMVISSIVGIAGLLPTYAAINSGKDIALANKETLVVAGDIIMPLVKKKGVKLLTLDSEHCAIQACLCNKPVKKLWLTASGGSFFNRTTAELSNVTVKDALNHPNWSMGAKITIDSASLMNKALEVIEAHHLFSMPYEQIDVVVQRESIIHSMVEYIDNSVIAQLAMPDMRLPIQTALTCPKMAPAIIKPMDFLNLKSLTFAPPDRETFRTLDIGLAAGKAGGSMPTVLNAANEMAVDAFLNGHIAFLQIFDIIEGAVSSHKLIKNPSLEEIINIDTEYRKHFKFK